MNEEIGINLEGIGILEQKLRKSCGELCETCGEPKEYAVKYGCPVGYSLPEINDCPYEKLNKNLNRISKEGKLK